MARNAALGEVQDFIRTMNPKRANVAEDKTDHPSKSVDDGTSPATEGSKSKENTDYAKEINPLGPEGASQSALTSPVSGGAGRSLGTDVTLAGEGGAPTPKTNPEDPPTSSQAQISGEKYSHETPFDDILAAVATEGNLIMAAMGQGKQASSQHAPAAAPAATAPANGAGDIEFTEEQKAAVARDLSQIVGQYLEAGIKRADLVADFLDEERASEEAEKAAALRRGGSQGKKPNPGPSKKAMDEETEDDVNAGGEVEESGESSDADGESSSSDSKGDSGGSSEGGSSKSKGDSEGGSDSGPPPASGGGEIDAGGALSGMLGGDAGGGAPPMPGGDMMGAAGGDGGGGIDMATLMALLQSLGLIPGSGGGGDAGAGAMPPAGGGDMGMGGDAGGGGGLEALLGGGGGSPMEVAAAVKAAAAKGDPKLAELRKKLAKTRTEIQQYVSTLRKPRKV